MTMLLGAIESIRGDTFLDNEVAQYRKSAVSLNHQTASLDHQTSGGPLLLQVVTRVKIPYV